MTIPELEAALERAREHQQKFVEEGTVKGSLKELIAANEAMLKAERALAAAKGEEYASPLELPVRWNTGAPLPHLLQSDYRTFLFFLLSDDESDGHQEYLQISPSDGTYGKLSDWWNSTSASVQKWGRQTMKFSTDTRSTAEVCVFTARFRLKTPVG